MTLLKNRNLLLLLQGQFVTHMGNQIYDMAMLLWIKELTGSASLMGLAMLMTNLPEAVLAPLGGKISDLFGRVRTMVVADLVSAAAIGIVVLSIVFGTPPSVMILALCFSNLVLGVSASCFVPAVLALIPELVPGQKLEKGNAAHQFSRMGGQVVGQGAGGLLFSALGAAGAFIFNSLSFLISAITEVWIKVPRQNPTLKEKQRGNSLLVETIEMLRKVFREPDLRVLLIFIAAFHLCLSCLPVLLPFYAEHVLHLSDRWFGFFIAAYTIGIMMGFIVAGNLKTPTSRFRLIATAGAIVGALFGVAASVSSYLIAWVVLLGIGIGIGVIIVNLMTELQLRSPESERGGIMGTAQAIGGSSFPLGMALTGIILDVMHGQGISYAASTKMVLAISAAASVLVAVTALIKNGRRHDYGRKAG
jgi:MFS family permease